MAIKKIDNDYPDYTVSDTLHQLVDKLNLMVNSIDSNTRQFDSSVGALESVIDAETGIFNMADDLVVNATNVTFNDSGDFIVNAQSSRLNTEGTLFVDAGTAIVLDGHNDLANIILRSNGSTYGSLRNGGGNLELLSGVTPVVSFTGSTKDAEFAGTITMPSTGTGSPATTSKTVDGALTELHVEIGEVNDSAQSAISTLQSRVTALENTVASYSSRIGTLETDVAYLKSLNIESKLNNHTTRLEDIEARLGLIGA